MIVGLSVRLVTYHPPSTAAYLILCSSSWVADDRSPTRSSPDCQSPPARPIFSFACGCGKPPVQIAIAMTGRRCSASRKSDPPGLFQQQLGGNRSSTWSSPRRQPRLARPILPIACSSGSTPIQLAIAVFFAAPQRLVSLFLAASSSTKHLPKAILTLRSAMLQIHQRLVAARVDENVVLRTVGSKLALAHRCRCPWWRCQIPEASTVRSAWSLPVLSSSRRSH